MMLSTISCAYCPVVYLLFWSVCSDLLLIIVLFTLLLRCRSSWCNLNTIPLSHIFSQFVGLTVVFQKAEALNFDEVPFTSFFFFLWFLIFVSEKLFPGFSPKFSFRMGIFKHILKGPDHKYFRLTGYSTSTTQLCCCRAKTVIDST